MDNNEQESGLTAGEVLKVIFKKKWLLLALTVVIAAVSTLIIVYAVNPNLAVYRCEFSISYPGMENSVYPDGTPFDYKSIVSTERLTAAKDGDPELADVDVSRMTERNDVRLTQNASADAGDNCGAAYTLTVKSNYFESAAAAKKFVTALVSYPLRYAKSCVDSFDFSNHLDSFAAANSYKSRIDHLVAQKELIVTGYESMTDEYGDMYAVGGRKIGENLAEVTLYFDNNRIDALYTELECNGYVIDSGYLDTVRSDIAVLEIEKEDNDRIIADLKNELADLVKIYGTSGAAVVTYESFNARITELTERNVKVDRELTILNTYLHNNEETAVGEAADAFGRKLAAYYERVAEFTAVYEDVVKTAANAETRVRFDYGSVIVGEGGVGWLVTIAGSLGGAFLIGCVVNLIIDMPKYLRGKKAADDKRKDAERAK